MSQPRFLLTLFLISHAVVILLPVALGSRLVLEQTHPIFGYVLIAFAILRLIRFWRILFREDYDGGVKK